MRMLTIHDVQGNIHHFVLNPGEMLPATVGAEPGLLTTEVEVPQEMARLDLNDPESFQYLREVVGHFRVERQAKARLVRSNAETS